MSVIHKMFLPFAAVLLLTACTSVPDFDSRQTKVVFTRAIERATPTGYIGETRVLAYQIKREGLSEPLFCIITLPHDSATVMCLQYVKASALFAEFRLMKDGTLAVYKTDGERIPGTQEEISSLKFFAAMLTGTPASDLAEKVIRKADNVLLLTRTGFPSQVLLTVNKVSNLPEKLEYLDEDTVFELQQVMVKKGVLTPGRVLCKSPSVHGEMFLLDDAGAEKLVKSIQKKK